MIPIKNSSVVTRTVGNAGEFIPAFSSVKYSDSDNLVYMTDTEGEPSAGLTLRDTEVGLPVSVVVKGEAYALTNGGVVAGEKLYADDTVPGELKMLAVVTTESPAAVCIDTLLTDGTVRVEIPIPNGVGL
jgi:hypothetical protein